jgi:hypothetical protein
MRIFLILLAGCCVLSVSCLAADDKRELAEACAVVSQQRNSLADGLAVIEARRKLESADAARRVTDWEEYFKAYIGAGS